MASHLRRHLLLPVKVLRGNSRIRVRDTTSAIRTIIILVNRTHLGRCTIKGSNVLRRKTTRIEGRGETEVLVGTGITNIRSTNNNAEAILVVVVSSNRNKDSIFVRTTKPLNHPARLRDRSNLQVLSTVMS